jgi:hypothetical protein
VVPKNINFRRHKKLLLSAKCLKARTCEKSKQIFLGWRAKVIKKHHKIYLDVEN